MTKHLTALMSALALVVLGAMPAAAADEIGLGRDGVTFASTLDGPLFDPGITWVPGDTRSETFYVRNQGGSAARLQITLLGDHMGNLLESGDVHVTATGDAGTSFVASDGSERRILTVEKVADRAIVPVTVTVAFDFSSPNQTQLRSTDLRLRINLMQATDDAGDDDTSSSDIGDSDRTGLLPDTGASVSLWLIALAAVSIGSGAAIVSTRRTTTEGPSHG